MEPNKNKTIRIRLMIQNPPSLGFGGGHVQALMYKKYVSRLGYDIDFVNPTDPKDEFDVLHVLGMQAGNCLNAIAAKALGKKIVLSPIFYTEANVPIYSLVNRALSLSQFKFSQNRFYLMQTLANLADISLPNSGAEERQMKKIFKVDSEKSHIIYNGVEPNLFDGVDSRAFANEYHIPLDYMLCVANINPRKNTLRLIKAFIESKVSSTLVLIGNYSGGSSDSYASSVQEAINAHKDKIIRIDNLRYGDKLLLSAYLGATVHILPSILETPGLASLEAGLAGCSLIVGDSLPVREYFSECALFCDPFDVSSIAQKINEAANGMVIGDARHIINEHYVWTIAAQKLANVYDSL
jgi:glycosyltransferase involved in cell wall biosynthesis